VARIVITGGAGFIGSQLGYRLHNDGHDVILVDDMSFGYKDNLEINGKTFGTFIKADVRSPIMGNILANVDYVFHFAGISSLPVCQQDPYSAVDINVGGTVNILEHSRRNGVKRVIFASTSAIYENNINFPSDETNNVAPDLVYATSKLQAEHSCRVYSNSYNLDVVIIRYYNVYGPHQDFRRLSPPLTGYILRELLLGNIPVLHSTGDQRRDYVYVDDVNDLNMLCMTHVNAPGNIFNAASGEAFSVKTIYSILAQALQSDIEPVFHTASKFWDKYPDLFEGPYPLKSIRLEKEVNKFTLGSYQKAKALLGWSPKMPFLLGLKTTADFAKSMFEQDNARIKVSAKL